MRATGDLWGPTSRGLAAAVLLLLLLCGASQAAAQAARQGLPPPLACPGLERGVCTLACQRATCDALGAFFLLSYNESQPWQRGEDWLITRRTPCSGIVGEAAARAGRPPAYCAWRGVSCCTPAAAAARACASVHGVANITITADSVNGSYSDPKLMDAFERLHACGMTGLNLESNDMSGQMGPRWGRFTNLTVLNLANSWLSGTIPPQLANLKQLRQLELGTNFLRGTIGSWIGELRQLEVLNLGANAGVNEETADGEEIAGITGPIPASIASLTKLRELDLQINSLTGTIPPNLCGPASPIRVLNVRGNRLRGPASPVTKCTKLASLDLGFNQLTGSLPASKEWDRMVSLMIGHNSFSGEVPETLYDMPMVTYLDISSNNLVGELNARISLLVYLTDLDASSNNLTGAVGSGLFFLPQIARLNLANNDFQGIIDPNLGLAYNLRELILVNNSGLIGRFPDEAAGLAHLRRVGLAGTQMSCEPQEVVEAAAAARARGDAPPVYKCAARDLLPCFLEFEGYTIPLSDNSKMSCRPIRRRSAAQVVASCPPAALAEEPVDSDGVLAAQWDLPPAYYQFQGCTCLEGWASEWSADGTRLECVRDGRAALPAWTWALVALGAALVLVAGSLLLLSSRLLLFQRRWLREAELKRKRQLGVPKEGDTAYVVVTDIEGYSVLMKTSPSLTTKALSMHNAVLRKAVAENAGNVFDQEGDSWGVAFYEAQDAVTFCLQAQQALQKVDWPLGLMGGGSETEYGAAPDGAAEPLSPLGSVDPPPSRLRQLLGVGSLGVMSLRSATSGGSSWIGPLPSITPHPNPLAPLGALPSFTSSEERADGVGGGARGEGGEGEGVLSKSNSVSSSLPHIGAPNPSGHSGSSHLDHVLLSVATERAAAPPGGRAAWGGGAARGSGGGGGTRRTFLKLLLRQSDAAGAGAFFGLRVRMGVAGGRLGGADVGRSAVFDLAKVICDMANGGQTLVDSETFAQIKDQPSLGAVDHHGHNDRLLVERAGGGRGTGALCCSCRGMLPCAAHDDEFASPTTSGAEGSSLVILDMGEYEVPGINVAAARGAARQRRHEEEQGGRQPQQQQPAAAGAAGQPRQQAEAGGVRQEAGGAAAPAAPGAAAPEVSAADVLSSAAAEQLPPPPPPQQKQPQQQPAGRARPDRLRVYSVLPACLSERAKVWRSSLSLKEGWRQTDRGFFDAPGAAAAARLTPRDLVPAAECMPPVTLVFAGVEGAKWLMRWRHAGEVREMARLLRLVLAAALRAVPGGYLCREQEGGLRYMLAFRSAEGALAWCLLAQEALMYAPWPPALLELPGFGEQHTPDGGTLLFRGPRLKMGVCEGRPRSLVADHAGRADYFGPGVNQAARYMDAAAHGGQVACELELAKAVFSEWRVSVEAPAPLPEGGPSRQSSVSLPWPPLAARAPSGTGERQQVPSRGVLSGPLPTVRGGAPGGAPPAAAPSPSAPLSPMAWPAPPERRPSGGGERDAWSGPQSAAAMIRGGIIQTQDDDPSAAQPPTPHAAGAAGSAPGGAPAPLPPSSLQSQPSDASSSMPPLLPQPSGGSFTRRAPLAGPPAAHPRWWPGHPRHATAAGGGGGGGEDDVLGMPGPSRTLSGTELISRSRHARLGSAPYGYGYGYGPAPLARFGTPGLGSLADSASPRPRPAPPTTFEDEAAALPRHAVAVRALHLGTFVFKGTEALEMASVTTAALAARQIYLPHEEAKGKGRKVSDRSGAADAAAPSLPDILPGLRDALLDAAAAPAARALAAQHAAAGGGGRGGGGGGGGGEGYAPWLAQELARRRLFEADGLLSSHPSMQVHSFTVPSRYPSGLSSGGGRGPM
ncbi:MAG: hypothetical protein J3K34DRAFT_519781 [Monoraphidium minutum]|nr:MAG: hypothetical protein J3K34DRAFT_519781 [Monoraphidium minutum]